MDNKHVIKTSVTPDLKEQVIEAARKELLSEALWLRRLVVNALRSPSASAGSDRSSKTSVLYESRQGGGASRLHVRLRPDDRLLLQARADARGMPAATYAGVLLRSHLRNLAPLPREELAALKRSNAELGAVGRNLNQIARIGHQTGRVNGPGRDDLRSMLKVCEAMRAHVKDLIRVNVQSWESGHAEAHD